MKIHARVINDEDYADSDRNITYDYAQNFIDEQNSFCFIEAGTLEDEPAFLIDIVFYSKRNATPHDAYSLLIKDEFINFDKDMYSYSGASLRNISEYGTLWFDSNRKPDIYSSLIWIRFDYMHFLQEDICLSILMNFHKLSW